MKDDLIMSVLGIWMNEKDALTATVLAQYQWDDYWNFSSALSYMKSNETVSNSVENDSDFTLTLKAKVQF